MRADPVAFELVGLLDGQRTARQVLHLLAARLGVPEEPFLPGLPAVLRRLLGLVILIPVDSRADLHLSSALEGEATLTMSEKRSTSKTWLETIQVARPSSQAIAPREEHR